MVDWKSVNDRKKRDAVLRSIVGDDLDDAARNALETAEAAEEAARFVRQMREAAKLTQDALAKKLGITQARVSEIERGGTPEGISYAVLRRVARACGFADWPVAPTAKLVEARLPALAHAEEKTVVNVVALDPAELELVYDAKTGRIVRKQKSAAARALEKEIKRIMEKGLHEPVVLLKSSTDMKLHRKLGIRAKLGARQTKLARQRQQVREVREALAKNPNFTVLKEE